MVEEFEDNDPVEAIDQSSASVQTCLIETRKESTKLNSSQKLIEFNFSKVNVSKKGHF